MKCWFSALLLGMTLGWSCCAEGVAGDLVRYESTQPQMGVPVKIILYARDEATAKGACEAAFARIAELNRVFSDYDDDSELSRLSRTAPAERGVPVSGDLWEVLTRAQALAEQTGGVFDATVGPYVRLWRRARRQHEMPSPDRLAEARSAVGWQYVELDARQRTARLVRPHMRLDLGGIAKGYAVDEALAAMRRQGTTRALVDAGGDIGVGDPPPGKHGWTIGVAPLSDDGTPSRQILLHNAAVATSGDAFQHVTIDGRRYSHVVDPRTGLGLTDQSGVTVIAPDCTTADSLATAVSVLGPQDGLALVEQTPRAAAFIVRAVEEGAPVVFESRGFSGFVAEAGER